MFERAKINSFLKKHSFSSKMIVNEILDDMYAPKPKNGGMDMSRTWMLPPEKNPENEKVIVIDAGGTNFRSCLVSFDGEGRAELSELRKTFMPATEKVYSKEEFFSAIADRIDYLKNKADKIGFCFSYSIDMTRDHDAIPNAFSKEFKARSILGLPVGKNLVEELEKRGWNKIKNISVVNDTLCALMAGKTLGINYSSYIGFILGTGMNAAFIAPEGNVWDEEKQEQIIVCESGKCNTFAWSDFDRDADTRTVVPVQFPLEKCCSGAYLGNVCLSILQFAAREGLFTKESAFAFLKLNSLSTIEIDDFLYIFKGLYNEPLKENSGENIEKNIIEQCCKTKRDKKTAFLLIDSAVDRVARYSASLLAANLIATQRGKNTEKVCIVCNGTTFYKVYKLKERIQKYLYEYATLKCGINFELVNIENDITLGAAFSALL